MVVKVATRTKNR